jgi:molybdopterin converting factor small subunit
MKILLFGVLADVVGESVIEMDSINDVDTLKRNVLSKFPLLNNYNFMIALNKERIENNISIKEGDEIALLPPFAGG